MRAFKEAGWHAKSGSDASLAPTSTGIHVTAQRDAAGKIRPLEPSACLIRDALEAAGMKFHLSSYGQSDEPGYASSFFFVFPPED